ncbi:MAG TPA: D-mannonate epimerase [Firmicutes bacterium]|nr:D-mannonate epimerase [Bacillota bacterium]
MQEIALTDARIDEQTLEKELHKWLGSITTPVRKVLLLPPDITRFHSKAGKIVQLLYKALAPQAKIEIMPALGTHMPMSSSERLLMFGPDIPADCFRVHDWRNDVIKIGEVPADYISEISGGLVSYPIDVEVNRHLLDSTYDLILSIGQVVPHEVVGMANYSKNIFVGCGGRDIINKTHFLGAVYGMENMMGRADTPVRRVFDYAEEHFLAKIPLQYILTVTTTKDDVTELNGLFIGRSRKVFEGAVHESQQQNLNLLDRPLNKVVVYLEPNEFRTTWLGNKAIYRTRMAIATGGELIILAPGLRQFGEDPQIDILIRKYGYVGSKRVLDLVAKRGELKENLSAAAHLIHGSSEDRFRITYAPGHLSQKEIEQVNFSYLSLAEAQAKYDPAKLEDGLNTLTNGEEVFYVSNPALGLWALKGSFQ